MAATSVLIVEDEPIVSLDLQQTLDGMGYQVVGVADTGEDAVALAHEHKPDVVLMDVLLKGEMDGTEASKQIHQTLGTPVVFLTAYSDPDTVRRAKESRPRGFLTKPYEPDALRVAIEIAAYAKPAESSQSESERWISTGIRSLNDTRNITYPAHERGMDVRITEDHFRQIFEGSAVGMTLVSLTGEFLRVNESFCRLLNYPSTELIGKSETMVTAREDKERERRHLEEILAGAAPSAQFEKRFIHRDGHIVWTLVTVSGLIEGGETTCYLYQIHDLTEGKRAQRQLESIAFVDALTGLHNRAHLHHELERELAVARRYDERFALAFVDLDDLKEINDKMGHEAGDELIRVVGQRLRATLRESDYVARWGGDEFVFVLPKGAEATGVGILTKKVHDAVSEPIALQGQEIITTASIGVSFFPDDGKDVKQLLRAADSALYAAKAEGKNHTQFFRPELTHRADERVELVDALQNAVRLDEFSLVFQPITRLVDGEIVAFEALIRWNHGQESVAPAEFLPVAEESGLIVQIGKQVMQQACSAASNWPTGIALHINFLARQLSESCSIEKIIEVLGTFDLEPGRFCLEFAEDRLVRKNTVEFEGVKLLRDLGVKTAIDQYGADRSSSAQLLYHAPNFLKIDRTLVQRMSADVETAAVVSAIVAMAHALGITVVAVGIETKEQMNRLQLIGCDLGQGFYFSRPLEADGALELLREHHSVLQT